MKVLLFAKDENMQVINPAALGESVAWCSLYVTYIDLLGKKVGICKMMTGRVWCWAALSCHACDVF